MKFGKDVLRQLARFKKYWRVLTVLLLVFAIANIGTWVLYKDRTYPKAHVAHKHLGTVGFDQLADRLQDLELLPDNIVIKHDNEETTVDTEAIGLAVDIDQTSQRVRQSRSWLPVRNLFAYNSAEVAFTEDTEQLDIFASRFVKQIEKPAKNASLILKNGEFQIAPDKDGRTYSQQDINQAISHSVAAGNDHVEIFSTPEAAKVTIETLKPKLLKLNKESETPITLTYANKTKSFSSTEIARWYVLKGSEATLSDNHILSSVEAVGQTFGILVSNKHQAVSAIKDALQETSALSFQLKEAPKPTKHFTYCVASRGVSTHYLGTFSAKLASVYADGRGWGLKGQVRFSKVSSGCDFTAWLSAASQMPSFGAICDSTWSCRVGPNVVINFDRWQNASPAWNQSGGSLDNYRSMVINHETGHWFGYYHAFCPGAGNPAPVMQQQSISLQGCKFNPWPTPQELVSHRSAIGL